MAVIALVAGSILPWFVGTAIVLAMTRRAEIEAPGEVAWRVGTGYLVGVFAITLWMRSLSVMHVDFGVVSIGGPLFAIALALWIWKVRSSRAAIVAAARSAIDVLTARSLTGWHRWAWFGLMLWIAVRFALLLAEIVWRPLYPWDAWTQWATKTRVFFELKHLVPFGFADQWFASGGQMYFDASPTYPLTVPLLQVWTNIAYGQFDDSLMNLPWWQIAIALACVAYGALRRSGYGPLAALAGTWIVTSLPLENVHVALAGYADLPMATFYAAATIATVRALDTRSAGDAALALILLIACPTVKTPGIVWALTLLPAVVYTMAGKYGLRIVLAGFVVVLVVLGVLAQSEPVILGYRLHLDFAPDWTALGQSFFLLDNWHLLWYGVITVLVLGRRQLLAPGIAPLTLVVVAGALFLLLVFGFTNARGWVADQTTINRAVLHLAPLAALWALMVFGAWSRASGAATAGTAPTAAQAA
jgi:hypothetical protein